jgi:Zn-dependent protease with chaperone function
LVFPAAWMQVLSNDVVSMQVTRRHAVLVTGARSRGIALALAWNTFGFVVSSQLPHANLIHVIGLINAGLWFTLWSFVGLLLLPSVNRPGVFEADRFAADTGIEKETMRRGMVDLDQLQDDEPDRSRWVERVFHPIPSVTNRMDCLLSDTKERGAWQGARMTLYLSWGFFGFLSRTVHCNVGRPELWVLFPGD